MNEQEKTCANCKNFKMYYVLNVSLRFIPIGKGHCIKRKVRRNGGNLDVEQNESCELWQSNELKKLRDQYVAEIVLQDISKKLEAVRVLLGKDDQ